ncbi:MAG: hypothetical protein ACREMA_06230 [Longimicrobiales bacterium]
MTQQRVARGSTLLLALLSACTEAPSRSGVVTTIDTVNGIERVRNQGEPPRWQLRELLILGSSAMGDKNYW